MTVETLLSPYEWMMQEKGRQEASQDAVLDVLAARFGVVPEEVVQSI